jgi:hypothetical protein
MLCPMDSYRQVLTHHRVLKHCSDPAIDIGVVRTVATSFIITDSVLKMVLILLKFSSSPHEIQPLQEASVSCVPLEQVTDSKVHYSPQCVSIFRSGCANMTI